MPTKDKPWGTLTPKSPKPAKPKPVKAITAACHSGNVKVFSWQNLHFWGGGWSRDAKMFATGVNVDLTRMGGHEEGSVDIRGFKPQRLQKWVGLKVIHLPTVDGYGPAMPREFWADFMLDMKDVAGEGELDILIFCVGGHGRTGTVLSVLAGLCLDVANPVKYIRKHYCKKAVETDKQLAYIKRITGLEFEAEARPPYTYVPGAVQHWDWDIKTKTWKTAAPAKSQSTKMTKWGKEIGCLGCEHGIALHNGERLWCVIKQAAVDYYDDAACDQFQPLKEWSSEPTSGGKPGAP